MKNRQILFNRDDTLFDELNQLIQVSDHASLVLWALALVEQYKDIYPSSQIDLMLKQCHLWAEGLIKMPQAKASILAVHGCAKETQDLAKIAYVHALAQACSVIHTPKHALGFPIYFCTYLVRVNKEAEIQNAIQDWCQLLIEKQKVNKTERKWAHFIRFSTQ